jgi:CRP/FNR family transcriptional regulator, cyclic AMP receptor protein
VSVQVRRSPQPLPLTLVLRQRGTLIRQGSPGDGLWLVESGALRVSVVSGGGHELVLDVLGPGHGAGEPVGVPSTATVRALRPCRLSPADTRTAANLLTARAHRAAAVAEELAWLDVRTRIVRRLDDLAERFGRPVEGGRLIVLPLTQDEVAALAGTTRESANRALRSMVACGEIRMAARGRYVVRTRLRSVADADPPPVRP